MIVVAAPLKRSLRAWLCWRVKPRVCCTWALIQCPSGFRTQSELERMTIARPQ
jgi:hypothetical protein